MVTPLESDLQAILHVHCQCELWLNGVMLHHLHMVSINDGGSNELHLIISEIFPQAQPRTSIESRKFVGRLTHEAAVRRS